MKKEKNRRVSWGIWGVMVIITIGWFLCFINKGIDLTDQAYYLTKYKYFFDENINIRSQGTLLTEMLGAFFYGLSDSSQVLLLSVCSWGLYLGSGLIIYITLKNYISRLLLLVAICGGCFFSLTWVHVMNYNATSMFIQTLSICILIRGIEKEQNGCFAISGILFALNTFFRLPNVLQIGLGVGILWYYLSCGSMRRRVIKPFLYYALGVLSGLVVGAGLSIALNGVENIYNFFWRTAETAGSSEDSHGIVNILEGIYNGLKDGFFDWIKYGWPLIVILIVWNIFRNLLKDKQKKQQIIFAGLSVVLFVYGGGLGFYITYLQFFQMIAVCIFAVMLVGVFYYRISNPFVSTICMICFCAEVILPIGTNNAWNYQKVFLIFPLCVCLLVVCQNTKHWLKSNLILCTVFCGVLLFSTGIKFAGNYVYRDAEYKELTYGVQAEEYYGIKTSEERAQYIDELDTVLKNFEGERLLAYGDFNIGYVISDMKPFFERVWSDLESYPLEDFRNDLKSGIEENGYPVILLADVDQNGQYRDMEKLRLLQDTIEEGAYKVYYENEWYQIYIPK